MSRPRTDEQQVERVRAAVRAALDRGVQAPTIAARVGISPAALYKFVAHESTLTPFPKTLAAYEKALSEVDERREASPSQSPSPSLEGLPDGGYARVPVTTLAYWAGRFDTMSEWARALDQLMQQQREQFTQFTRGVDDFRHSGVLPQAETVVPDPERGAAGLARLREAAAAAERAEAGQPAAPRRRA